MHDSMIAEERASREKGTYTTDGVYKTKKKWATEFEARPVTPYNSLKSIIANDLKQAFKVIGPLGGKVINKETCFRNGIEYREIIYEIRSDIHPNRKSKTTYVDKDVYILIIRSSCVSSDFPKAENDFDSIAGSLKFF